MKQEIIREFQACLNEAITAGRKPWGRGYTRAYNTIRGSAVYGFERVKGSPIVYPDSYVFDGATNFSLTNILFDTDSGFLDMIEWKDSYREKDYYSNQKEHHMAHLAILESDEKRIEYVLDNMKGLVKE